MTVDDRNVLEFIGRQGKSPEAVAERFPGFNVRRLVKAGLVRMRRTELAETQMPGHSSPTFVLYCVLTERGARAVGIDPLTLHLT
jgi:hypothetical protein